MQHTFQGIWVPIVTPFTGERIDHAALARLARHLADQGIAGLVSGATTGEGCSLSPAERIAVFETLRAELGLDYPLMGRPLPQRHRQCRAGSARAGPSRASRSAGHRTTLPAPRSGRLATTLRSGRRGQRAATDDLRHPVSQQCEYRTGHPAGTGPPPEHRRHQGVRRKRGPPDAPDP